MDSCWNYIHLKWRFESERDRKSIATADCVFLLHAYKCNGIILFLLVFFLYWSLVSERLHSFTSKWTWTKKKATTTSWAVPDFKVTLPQYGKSSARQFVSLEKSRQLFSLSNAWKRNTSTRPAHTELHRSMNGNGQPVSQKWSGSVLLRDLISLDFGYSVSISFPSISLSVVSSALFWVH